jgi:hypothetical protein
VLTHLFPGFASPLPLVGIKRITTNFCHPERSAAKSKDLHSLGNSLNENGNPGAPRLAFETWVRSICFATLFISTPTIHAQNTHAEQPLGSVKTDGAEVSGLVSVSNGKATIGNNGAVTAGAQAAVITLARGGEVHVCAGSAVHLSQTSTQARKPPMMMAVDRGAVEIHTSAEKTDAILTPDLRFELSGAAPLDLRIRMVPNGDTCVDNSGKDAPVLHVTETFGDATYFIRPGQRVLFEHGSLREVVDHESSSCGCPRGDAQVLAGKGKKGDGKVPDVVKQNPFPEAVSQGLQAPAPPTAVPQGEVHTQVSSTLNYSGATNAATGPPGQTITAADVAAGASAATDGNGAATAPNAAGVSANEAATTAPTATTTTAANAGAPAPPPADLPNTGVHVEQAAPPPAGPNPFKAIGRFFQRLFGVHPSS